MKYIVFLALALLAGTLLAGTGQSVLVDGAVTYQQPCPTPEVAIIKVQDAVVSWKPEVTYQERDVQVQIPPAVRLQSVPTVSSPTVQYAHPQVSIPTVAPTVTSTYTQCQTIPTMQTYSVPQTVTYQSCPQTTCTSTQCYTPQCTNGYCYPPSNYVADSDLGTNIRYEPAVIRTEDGYERVMRTPIRAACTMLRINRQPFDRDPPSLPVGPGNGGGGPSLPVGPNFP